MNEIQSKERTFGIGYDFRSTETVFLWRLDIANYLGTMTKLILESAGCKRLLVIFFTMTYMVSPIKLIVFGYEEVEPVFKKIKKKCGKLVMGKLVILIKKVSPDICRD